MNILLNQKGYAVFKNKTYKTTFGSSGIRKKLSEGDNITPIGSYPLRRVFYRHDRIATPQTDLPLFKIKKTDGWCNDINAANYNLLIKTPSLLSHERLWRKDNIYDIIVPIGYNDKLIIPNLGSAIFLHLASHKFTSTLGCVGFKLKDILNIIKYCNEKSLIKISLS
jgi:L,D-peptidoglycan transpeptidase YkuD (ErfK/YbiS/YcfS/YnhG family)